MTFLDLYPFLLLLGVFGLGVLWAVRRVVATGVAARRLATAAMGFLAVVMVTSLVVRLEAPAQGPSSRLLSWQLNRSASGPGLDPATAQAMTAFFIEVEPAGCAPIVVGPWLADPIVTYTPWSVTITMYVNDAAPPSLTSGSPCPPHQDLPSLGSYRLDNIYQVHLREPLGGRVLLDGSSFPPQERPYR